MFPHYKLKKYLVYSCILPYFDNYRKNLMNFFQISQSFCTSNTKHLVLMKNLFQFNQSSLTLSKSKSLILQSDYIKLVKAKLLKYFVLLCCHNFNYRRKITISFINRTFKLISVFENLISTKIVIDLFYLIYTFFIMLICKRKPFLMKCLYFANYCCICVYSD